MSHKPFVGGFRLALLLVALTPLSSLAQTCPQPPVYCEGWARDSSHREVTLTGYRGCTLSCTGHCAPSDIIALPSIRIGTYQHVVLGFSISNACQPECPGFSEPCFNVGVSYRWRVGSSTEAPAVPTACDPDDPEPLAYGATFDATYLAGGSDNVVISDVIYPDCGGPPSSLNLAGTGTSLGVSSHFQLVWQGDQIAGWSLVGYTEDRSYTNIGIANVVHITVTNINYLGQTYDVSVLDAETPTLRGSWGQLRIRYR